MPARHVFTLDLQPESESTPPRLALVLVGLSPDQRGFIHLTPECSDLEQLERCIAALQAELAELQEEARMFFTEAYGHG